MENIFKEDEYSPSYSIHTPKKKNENYNLINKFIVPVNTSSSTIPIQPIIFDLLRIESSLRTMNEYIDEISLFKYYNNKVNTYDIKEKNYLTKITTSFCYIGVLTNQLKKCLIGNYYYENQDQYIGQWKNDVKEGYGIYFYYNETNLEELYIGNWKNGKKNGKGFYIWKFSNNSIKFNNSNYDVIYGNFEDDNFINGYSITKNEKNYFVYYGKFDNGRKNDENAFFFENNDMGFYGKFENDELKEGRIALFKKNDNNIFMVKQSYNIEKSKDKNNDIFNFVDDKEKDEYIIKKRYEVFGKNFNDKFNDLYNYSKELLNKFSNIDSINDINIKEFLIKPFENFLRI